MTAEMQNYYKELTDVQNHSVNVNQDIMTITGFMNWDEKQDHLRRYQDRINEVK